MHLFHRGLERALTHMFEQDFVTTDLCFLRLNDVSCQLLHLGLVALSERPRAHVNGSLMVWNHHIEKHAIRCDLHGRHVLHVGLH